MCCVPREIPFGPVGPQEPERSGERSETRSYREGYIKEGRTDRQTDTHTSISAMNQGSSELQVSCGREQLKKRVKAWEWFGG